MCLKWEFSPEHSRLKDTVRFLKDGRRRKWNKLGLLPELQVYTLIVP